MLRKELVLCAVALMLLGCGKTPERPNVDGYTLQGFILDADTDAPVSEVNVLVGFEPELEFHAFALTDGNGAFLFQPFPATGPNNEIFRFEKAGYVPLEVPARTATRLEEGRYRVQAHIQAE